MATMPSGIPPKPVLMHDLMDFLVNLLQLHTWLDQCKPLLICGFQDPKYLLLELTGRPYAKRPPYIRGIAKHPEAAVYPNDVTLRHSEVLVLLASKVIPGSN